MAQVIYPFSMDESPLVWTPERLAELTKVGSSPVNFYRDTEATPEKELDIQMSQNTFLERLDNQTHGMPPWYLAYCDAHDPRHETLDWAYQKFLYQTGQETDPRVVSFWQQCDGEASCHSVDMALDATEPGRADWYQSSTTVGGYTSTPQEEPWQNGTPAGANYVELPLPQATTPTQEGYFPSSTELAARIMGNGGHWIKQISQEMGVHYIWYDAEREVFCIYGDRLLLPATLIRMHTHFWHSIRKFDREWYGNDGERDPAYPLITTQMYAQLWGPHNQCYNWDDLKSHYLMLDGHVPGRVYYNVGFRPHTPEDHQGDGDGSGGDDDESYDEDVREFRSGDYSATFHPDDQCMTASTCPEEDHPKDVGSDGGETTTIHEWGCECGAETKSECECVYDAYEDEMSGMGC